MGHPEKLMIPIYSSRVNNLDYKITDFIYGTGVNAVRGIGIQPFNILIQ